MAELRSKIDELAQLMKDFNLERARLQEDEISVEFAVNAPTVRQSAIADSDEPISEPTFVPQPSIAPVNMGLPINSPMMGVFYTSPSPGNPPFVNEGDTVTAGQVVGLIEAMKVFNEITSPTSGTVTKIAAESGRLVQPGEPLLYIS